MKNIEVIPVKSNPKENKGKIEKKRVAAYIRVSTLFESQNNSYEQQLQYYTQLIKNNPSWIFAGIYADKGISGSSIKQRSGFQSLIADCMAGKIDMIRTKSVSRFARNTTDTLNTLRQLKRLGIGVYFERENIWTLDDTGEFLITILASYAQEESRSISNNVKWGIRKGYAKGKYCFRTKNFLGYGEDRTINEDEAVIIRLIYRLFLQGYSPYAIKDILNEKGVKRPWSAEKWYETVIISILKNEKYMGDTLLQKKYVDDFISHHIAENTGQLPMYLIHEDHDAIISKQVFDKVQEIFMESTKSTSYKHPLSNKIVCRCCGSKFRPVRWHSTTYNQRVWKCKGCKNNIHLYEKELYGTIISIWKKLIVKYADSELVHQMGTLSIGEDDLGFDELSIILESIIVYPNSRLRYKFIDGKSMFAIYKKSDRRFKNKAHT